MEHEIVQHEQAWHASQGLVEESVARSIPHLIHGDVVGPLAMRRQECPHALDTA